MKAFFTKHHYLISVACILVLASCSPTYHRDYIEDSIKKICQDEYGITDVVIKLKGNTLGVYLPLDQLFSLDYEKFLRGEAMGDLESLVQFHPDALTKVEDVLFSTSRVILSTDRKIDFYLMNATDTLVTGIQFTIVGNVLDMKRVRFWDIPRSEYRKRLIHDLSINRAVLWKRNVIDLFEGVSQGMVSDVLQECCVSAASITTLSPYFNQQLIESYKKDELTYEIMDIRAKPFREKEVLVYAKVRETYTPKPEFSYEKFHFESGFVGEYLFILTVVGMEYKILQVIPFYIINDDGTVKRIDFPNELKIYKDLEEWPDDFDFDEIFLEEFLAEQITKRLQADIGLDRHINDKFILGKPNEIITCSYENILGDPAIRGKDAGGYFSFYLAMRLKEKLFITVNDLKQNEDLLYLLEMVAREFAYVMNAYSFKDYTHMELHLPLLNQGLIVTKEDIQKFYKNKASLEELLNKT